MAVQETGQADAVSWAVSITGRADVLYLDTETTGLRYWDEIVEIAAVDNAGRVLLDTLVKPRGAIPANVIAIHGITDQTVRDAPLWPDVYPLLVELFHSYPHIVVYNADFDRRLIGQSCAAHTLRLPRAHWHCAMKQYAAFVGDHRWHNLGHAVQRLSVTVVPDHRALSDARACRAVVRAMACLQPTPGRLT